MFFRRRSERNFLLSRLIEDDYTWVGISSNEMVRCAIERKHSEPDPYKFPRDRGDLGRCEETFKRAPRHMQRRMKPILERFRQHVAEREASRT